MKEIFVKKYNKVHALIKNIKTRKIFFNCLDLFKFINIL